MSEKEFTNFLGIVMVPCIVNLISLDLQTSFDEALNLFYNSEVYSCLEKETTKFWHFSHRLLANLFLEEHETGTFLYPEGAA